jgi:hypothetical protein
MAPCPRVISAMPNELTVGAIQPLPSAAEKAPDPKAEAFVAPQAPVSAEASQIFVNPTKSFDSTLGLVVLEFRDQSGNVSMSIPSQRQLQAYRLHQQPLPGQGHLPPQTSTPPPQEVAPGTATQSAAAATAVPVPTPSSNGTT